VTLEERRRTRATDREGLKGSRAIEIERAERERLGRI
jgi:hypothetical protein